MKEESWAEHNAVQVSSEESQEKADRLAPLEERRGQTAIPEADDKGLIKVDTGSLKIPTEFTEKREGKSYLFGLEPVAIIIMVFSLAFIAFIAYLISQEPQKPLDEPAPPAASATTSER